MKFYNSTTDTILFIITIALVVFTFRGITDPKDFITYLSMVASYKFGRAVEKATQTEQQKTVPSQDDIVLEK